MYGIRPLFSKSKLNLARFDTKFVAVRKILLYRPYVGKFGEFGLKALFVSYPALSLSVSQKRQADHESTNEEDFRGCSRGDKPVFIEGINR